MRHTPRQIACLRILFVIWAYVSLSSPTLFAQTGEAVPERNRRQFLQLLGTPVAPAAIDPYRNFKFQVGWDTGSASSIREHILLARQVGHSPGPIIFLQPTVILAETIGHTLGFAHEHQNPGRAMDQDGIDDIGLWIPNTSQSFGGYRPQFYFPTPDVSGAGKPLLIIAKDIEGEALSTSLRKPDVIILDEPTGTPKPGGR